MLKILLHGMKVALASLVLFGVMQFSGATAFAAISLPGKIQAENWTQMFGVATESCSDTGGGLDVGGIDDGDWMDYSVNVSAAGAYTVQFRTASPVNTGVIQLRQANGTVLGTVQVPNTGGWQSWTTVSTTVTLPAGTQTLRIYAQTGNWNINWFQALPNFQGNILYHSYSDYSAGDSNLYLLKLSDQSVQCLSCGWSNVYNAMNGHFSPDGTKATFMGFASGTSNWDVWLYTFGDAQPVNLTNSGGVTRNEDSKFSPDGSKIVIKQKQASVFSIKEINLSGSVVNTVSSGTAEKSMPYYTTDGQSIVYTTGSTPSNFDIHKVNTNGTGDVGLLTTANVSEYYPIVRDASSFFYTGWVSASDHHDQIYLKIFAGGRSLMPFNEPNSDYSDPYPIGSRYVLVSSNRSGGKGGYDLYIADADSGQIWSLDQYNSSINSANHELGSSYTPY